LAKGRRGDAGSQLQGRAGVLVDVKTVPPGRRKDKVPDLPKKSPPEHDKKRRERGDSNKILAGGGSPTRLERQA